MTKEEIRWAKVFGALFAILLLIFIGVGLFLGLKALDDGPAHRPSEWKR